MSYNATIEIKTEKGMETLRAIFPRGQADELNFVLFSTSGVHGTRLSIEEAEKKDFDEDQDGLITFLVIKPRIVQTLYGNCHPKTPEDFKFLKKLRKTSRAAIRFY